MPKRSAIRRFPSHHGLQKTVEQLAVLIRRGLEAWPMCVQVLLRSAEGAATGAFALREHKSNLRKLVLEDLTQQEDRSLEGKLAPPHRPCALLWLEVQHRFALLQIEMRPARTGIENSQENGQEIH